MVESLKKEVDMLRSLNEQESKRKSGGSWFGMLAGSKGSQPEEENKEKEDERKFGMFGTVVPSEPKPERSAPRDRDADRRCDRRIGV